MTYREKRYNKLIETIEIFKALANEHRLQILNWLKHPKDYFVNELHAEIDEEAVGVCVVVGKMWSHRAPLIFFLDDPIRELDWTLGLKEAFSRADSLGLPKMPGGESIYQLHTGQFDMFRKLNLHPNLLCQFPYNTSSHVPHLIGTFLESLIGLSL